MNGLVCLAVTRVALTGLGGIDFQTQIDAVAARGGGRVTVPCGRHWTKGLVLRSNVELHLADGAYLLGSSRTEDYSLVKLPYSEGDWRAVVMGVGVTNVAITGHGIIDGQGGAFPQVGVYSGGEYERGLRPRGLFFANCRDVRLADFLFRDSACWGVVFKCCDGVTVERLTIDNHVNHNNDGIDVEARNVTIRDCDVDSGDDAICIKSNDPHFVVENVLVSNVTARSHSNALKLGTASHGTMRNIRFVDCRTEAPRHDYLDKRTETSAPRFCFTNAERFETRPGLTPYEQSGIAGIAIENVDGGVAEDISFCNIDVAGNAVPIFVRGGRRMKRKCGIPPSDRCVLRNILIENVKGSATTFIASSITGVEGCRARNVTLRNVRIACRAADRARAEAAKAAPVPEHPGAYPESNMFRPNRILPAYGLYVRHADGVVLDDVTFTLPSGAADTRAEIVKDDAEVRMIRE